MKSERELILQGFCDPGWSAEVDRALPFGLLFDSPEDQTFYLKQLFDGLHCRRRCMDEIEAVLAVLSYVNGPQRAFLAMVLVEDAIASGLNSEAPYVGGAWPEFSAAVASLSPVRAQAASRWCSLVSQQMTEARDTHGARLWLIASFHAASRFLGAEIGRVYGEILEFEKDYALRTGSVPDWWDEAGARSGEKDCVAAVMGEMVASLDEAARAARLIEKLSQKKS